MDKNGLLDLMTRINTQEVGVAGSRETVRWKALREAETLTGPELFPLLQEIVLENRGKAKAKRDVRMAAAMYGTEQFMRWEPAPEGRAGRCWHFISLRKMKSPLNMRCTTRISQCSPLGNRRTFLY